MNKEDPNEDWCAVCSDGGEVCLISMHLKLNA